MSIITLDLETYYDQSEYTLKKMSTEDYVDDPRFEVVGLSHMVDDGPRKWFTDTMKETGKYLKSLKLDRHALCAHNTKFDGLILARHFDVFPRVYLDTLSMATPSLKPRLKSLSLASLAAFFGLPDKGDEVVRASGKRRLDFTPEELAAYGEYCDHDTWLCREIFKRLRENIYQLPATAPNGKPWGRPVAFPNDELELIDITLRMYLQPQFQLSAGVFQKGLAVVREKKATVLSEMEVMGITGPILRSSEKFAGLLRARGIDPPMKDSPTSVKKGEKPPKKTYAFGKDDPEFLDLREEFSEDLEMTMIFNARIGEKSTQEETRNIRLLEIAERYGHLRVPAQYYSAHTGRYAGSDGINLLNLPNVDKSSIRYGIVAPPGHVVIASDYAAVEARLVATLAGQTDLVEIFATGRDPYSEFATELFGFPVSKALADADKKVKLARRLGKDIILGCLAKGTRVYCERGLVPIEEIKLSDRVWDGDGWTEHGGLLQSGTKETLQLSGVWLTPDHLVWSGAAWNTAQSLEQDAEILFRSLGFAKGNSPSLGTFSAVEGGSSPCLLPATVGRTCTLSIPTASGIYPRLAAPSSGVASSSKSPPSRKRLPTYDIAFCGPKSRFLIETDRGPLLVHNSGFGMGPPKFKRSVRKNNSGVTVTDAEAEKYIQFYRDRFSMIPQLWRVYDAALRDLVLGRKETQVGPVKFVWLDKKDAAILLPNGMMLLYPRLRTHKVEYSDGTYETKIVCNHARDKFPRNIWGGVITENICQALSRVITCEDMLEIKRRLGLNTAIQVYDSVGFVVEEGAAPEMVKGIEEIMVRRRPWLPDLPLGVESKIGPSFGHV